MFEALSKSNATHTNEEIICSFANSHVYGKGHDFEECITELSKAVEENDLRPYHEYFKAIRHYYLGQSVTAEKIYEKIGEEFIVGELFKGFILINRGSNFRSLGRLDEAISNINHGLELLEEIHLTNYRAFGNYQLGSIYLTLDEFDKAEKYFLASLGINKIVNNRASEYRVNAGLGNLYLKVNRLETAYNYLKKAEVLSLDKPRNESNSYHDLGLFYLKSGDSKKALEMVDRAIKIREAIQLEDATSTSLILKGKIYLQQNKYTECIDLLESTLVNLQKSKSQLKEKDCLAVLSDAYEAIGDESMALNYLKRFNTLQKELLYKQHQQIQKKTSQYIQEQNSILIQKNKAIQESIDYSRHLQNAILPPQELIKKYFPKSFVYYQPKDIVAGDFYWISSYETRPKGFGFEEIVLLAAADCTGHGVPGAIVSFICSDILNQSVDETSIFDPAKLLDRTLELLVKRFKMSSRQINDGMDISLVAYNTKTNELRWAGANNPIYYLKNQMFYGIKGDKQSIGYSSNYKHFTNHDIRLLKGDRFFLGTDGYSDQFGGPRNKKLGNKKYVGLIENSYQGNKKNDMNEIHELLQAEFIAWKGSEEQIDDICILGVEI